MATALDVLGIDLGTSAVKALIVSPDGTVRGRGSAPYPIDHHEPDWAEQDPESWWHATIVAVRQAIAATPDCEIAAIGLSGQMHGTVLLGASSTVGPAIIWSDRRCSAEVNEITNAVGHAQLVTIAGSALATGFQAASVRWVQRHQPERWRDVQTVLLPKDYLGWRLTGNLVTEPSDASSTLLFDIQTSDWSNDILRVVGIDRTQLPPIINSTNQRGTITADVADRLGIPVGTPVIAGGADAPLAALGAGVVEPSTMLLTLSSGSQVLVPKTTPTIDPLGRTHTWRSCLNTDARWYQMGATLASGLALTWLRENVFALDGPDAYHDLDQWAAATPPGASGLLFLPYLAGERTPHFDPHARGIFLGLTTTHHRGHLTRAVMEGAALALFDAAQIVTSAGSLPNRIVLAGGGARSATWRQIIADVFGVPVSPLATVDGSALGAAMLAGASVGLFDLTVAARDWVRYDEPIEPNTAAHETYQRLFEVFREAYAKHREDFRVLAGIG